MNVQDTDITKSNDVAVKTIPNKHIQEKSWADRHVVFI